MKKIFISFLCLFALYCRAGNGWFNDYIIINANHQGDEYYWIGDNPDYGTPFDTHDFGEVSSLILNGCDFKYWCDDQDRTGGSFYYMIKNGEEIVVPEVQKEWEQSTIPGWGKDDYQGILSGLGIDLLDGLESGITYELYIWAKNSGESGDRWLSNNSNNYIATFTPNTGPSIPYLEIFIPDIIIVNQPIILNYKARNMENPVFTFYIKTPGTQNYTEITSPYIPTKTGTYTFKVSAAESTAPEDILLSDEKEVYVKEFVEGITIGVKKPDDWNSISFYYWSESTDGNYATPYEYEEDFYIYIFDESLNKINLVFINGTSFSTRNNQTIDITGIEESRCFEIVVVENEEDYEEDEREKRRVNSISCPFDISSNLEKIEAKASVNIQNNLLSVNFPGSAKINLFTITGQIIKSLEVQSEFSTVLQQGIYLLQINGEVHKIIIN